MGVRVCALVSVCVCAHGSALAHCVSSKCDHNGACMLCARARVHVHKACKRRCGHTCWKRNAPELNRVHTRTHLPTRTHAHPYTHTLTRPHTLAQTCTYECSSAHPHPRVGSRARRPDQGHRRQRRTIDTHPRQITHTHTHTHVRPWAHSHVHPHAHTCTHTQTHKH